MIKLDLPTKGEIKHLFKEGVLTSIKNSDGALLTLETDANFFEAIRRGELNKRDYIPNSIWLKDGSIAFPTKNGEIEFEHVCPKNPMVSIMPVIRDKSVFEIYTKYYRKNNSVFFYTYPLFVANSEIQKELEREFQNKDLIEIYTEYDFGKHSYFYKGKTYVRYIVKSNEPCINTYNKIILSDNALYEEKEPVWLEVTELEWLIDNKNKILISKYPIIGGTYYKDNSMLIPQGVRYYLKTLGILLEHNLDCYSSIQYHVREYNKKKDTDDLIAQMIINKYDLPECNTEDQKVLRR